MKRPSQIDNIEGSGIRLSGRGAMLAGKGAMLAGKGPVLAGKGIRMAGEGYSMPGMDEGKLIDSVHQQAKSVVKQIKKKAPKRLKGMGVKKDIIKILKSRIKKPRWLPKWLYDIIIEDPREVSKVIKKLMSKAGSGISPADAQKYLNYALKGVSALIHNKMKDNMKSLLKIVLDNSKDIVSFIKVVLDELLKIQEGKEDKMEGEGLVKAVKSVKRAGVKTGKAFKEAGEVIRKEPSKPLRIASKVLGVAAMPPSPLQPELGFAAASTGMLSKGLKYLGKGKGKGRPRKTKRPLTAYQKHMSMEMKKGKSFKEAVASWKSKK